MRKWIGITGCLAAIAFVAGPAAAADLLTNGGFEIDSNGDDVPDGWTMDGEVHYPDCSGGGWYGAMPRTGVRMIAASTNWVHDAGTVEQTVTVTSGTYDLALSFWAWLRDDAGFPSSVSGEILVDGEVVAAAGIYLAGDDQVRVIDYTQVVAAWKGPVDSEITARITLIADGPGCSAGDCWGIVAVDDVELLTSECGTQHEIDPDAPIVPNVYVMTQPPVDTMVTITGSNLDQVTGVRLWRSGPHRQYGEPIEVPGTIQAGATPTSMDVLLATSGAAPGFYDLIVEQTNCNPRVITGGFEVLDPEEPQNLLVNPSFELPDNSGNGQIWFGDYVSYSDPHHYGARQHVPTPRHMDGEWGLEFHDAVGTLINTDTYQAVPVTSGDDVTFGGWVHTGPGGTGVTNTATFTVWDGQIGGTTIAPPVTVNEAQASPDWYEVTIAGTAYNGWVTVQVETTVQGGAGGVAAVHLDAFSLTVDPETESAPCTTGQRPRFAYPSSATHLDNAASVTITGGTNLDVITAVSLIFVDDPNPGGPPVDEPELVIPGAITAQSAVSFTAVFDIVGSGAKAGPYNVAVEKASCPTSNLEFARIVRGTQNPPYGPDVPETFVDYFEVRCGTPIIFESIDPVILNAPQESVDFTIIGQNLDQLDTISLVLDDPYDEIPGTMSNITPGQITATFYLGWANPGTYDLVGTRQDNLCANPEPLAKSFALLVPPGEQLLVNGDFEAEGPQDRDAQPGLCDDYPESILAWSAKDMGIYQTSGFTCFSGEIAHMPKYDGSTHVQDPVAGDNHGSIDGRDLGYAFQTVTVIPNRGVTLTGWIAGGNTGEKTYRHAIRVLDGDETGAVLAELEQTSPPGLPWTEFELAGAPSGYAATVEWGYSFVESGWVTAVATHVDELVLVQAPAACNDPFADADGDSDVDHSDFGVFQMCYTGTNGGVPSGEGYEYCPCFDVEGVPGDDVDQADLAAFEACGSGPGITADDTCDD